MTSVGSMVQILISYHNGLSVATTTGFYGIYLLAGGFRGWMTEAADLKPQLLVSDTFRLAIPRNCQTSVRVWCSLSVGFKIQRQIHLLMIT